MDSPVDHNVVTVPTPVALIPTLAPANRPIQPEADAGTSRTAESSTKPANEASVSVHTSPSAELAEAGSPQSLSKEAERSQSNIKPAHSNQTVDIPQPPAQGSRTNTPQINAATAAFPGGQATVFNTTPNAFSLPAPGLERMQELLFFVGNSFFNQNWVTAPASTTARDGLGPMFNARSCAGCHFKDGRGRPPDFAGEFPTGFLVRLSIPSDEVDSADLHHAPVPEPFYGRQLQVEALLGIEAEGQVGVEYQEMPGQFADGTAYSLRKPTYTITELGYGKLHPDTMISPRVANQMIGLGLLEAIPESALLALADPDDADGDGISGRPNYVWDELNGAVAIGRFGWKANQPNLVQQVASAFSGDMGIATSLHPEPNCTVVQLDCLTAPNGASGHQASAPGAEIDDDDFEKVVLYSSALAVPARRNIEDPTVQAGQVIFVRTGCASCHVPMHQTGQHPTIDALSNQTIYPYTDLLLHDMGDGLADGRPDFEATGNEWRTPPLWGLGLVETVNRHTYYLHDGRARSILEAILWHGGEAEPAKERLLELSKEERDALVAFVKSL